MTSTYQCTKKRFFFATADKIDGTQRKLKAWKFRVSRNSCDMFQHLSSVIEDAGKNLNVKSIQNTTSENLTNLIVLNIIFQNKKIHEEKMNGSEIRLN